MTVMSQSSDATQLLNGGSDADKATVNESVDLSDISISISSQDSHEEQNESSPDQPLTQHESPVQSMPKIELDTSIEMNRESNGLCSSPTFLDDGLRSRALSTAMKDQIISKLEGELNKAKEELKVKDEQCERLSRIRGDLEREIEELTASLFEEANKMVNEAKREKAVVEKQLEEAESKAKTLKEECDALKHLVSNASTTLYRPSTINFSKPRRQSDQPVLNSISNPATAAIKASQRRSPSHNDVRREAAINSLLLPPPSPVPSVNEFKEFDPIYFKEFTSWKENPVLELDCHFLSRINQEDISACLNFPDKEMTTKLLACIMDNTMIIEEIPSQGFSNCDTKICAVSQCPSHCKYRIKYGENGSWLFISNICRNRIVAVCDFFTYLRYIQQGIVKQTAIDVYWEIVKMRKQMALARLGIA